MLLNMVQHIVEPAERLAEKGAGLNEVLPLLRQLSLDDFGRLIFGMPSVQYPALSSLLPAMAAEAMQTKYTGSAGLESLKRTLPFIRQLENAWTRHTGKKLSGETILDFGCGYGRMIRMMYYYTDTSRIWGVDVSDEALKLCADVGLQGNFAKSQPVPASLPLDGTTFDLAYTFSVFTHLAPKSAEASLAAVRDSLNDNGILVATIRPTESWTYLDQLHGTSSAPRLIKEFNETGFAYVPHAGPMGETYGNASIAPSFFTDRGWKMLAYDSYIADPLQVSLILQKN
jgi:SAM-dependent methyltransferase